MRTNLYNTGPHSFDLEQNSSEIKVTRQHNPSLLPRKRHDLDVRRIFFSELIPMDRLVPAFP